MFCVSAANSGACCLRKKVKSYLNRHRPCHRIKNHDPQQDPVFGTRHYNYCYGSNNGYRPACPVTTICLFDYAFEYGADTKPDNGCSGKDDTCEDNNYGSGKNNPHSRQDYSCRPSSRHIHISSNRPTFDLFQLLVSHQRRRI